MEKHAPRTLAPYSGPFPFADLRGVKGSQEEVSYIEAYQTLAAMMEDKAPLDLRKAVYAVERPWMGGRVSEAELTVMLDYIVRSIGQTLRAEGLDAADPLVKHYGIQKLYRDTLMALGRNRPLPPFQYDFNDFMGQEDPANLMVTKLLLSGKGQCRSMPLLYMLLAEAMGIEAFLAFSPSHSYIVFRGHDGTFHNFEPTNGHLTTDAWVKGSGFVKSEAVRSGIYMDTVGVRGVLAQLLVDLAGEYRQRFGYDEAFMGACLQLALKAAPTSINARLLLSDLRTAGFDRAAWEQGLRSGGDINAYPALAERLRELHALYDHIDDLGHAEMPEEAYIAWLRSLEDEKRKREAEERRQQLIIMPLDR